MTSGSHHDSKPYANWALLGAACSYAIGADERSSIDKAVLKTVGIKLEDRLDRLFPGRGESYGSAVESLSESRRIRSNIMHK